MLCILMNNKDLFDFIVHRSVSVNLLLCILMNNKDLFDLISLSLSLYYIYMSFP